MIINRRLLKSVILYDENFHFTPSAQQIDYLYVWFPEIFTEGKHLKRNWMVLLKGKFISPNQYRKLSASKLSSIEDSKINKTKVNWKKVDYASKECEIETGKLPEHIHHAFLRRIFSLISVKIIDISIEPNGDTSVMFDYYGKILQAECIELPEKLPDGKPNIKMYLWTSVNEKIDCSGKEIKECIEKYIANAQFETPVKQRSLKLDLNSLAMVYKKWRPRHLRIENIYTGKSGTPIQPAIVLLNLQKEPIAILTPGEDCDLALERSKYFAQELGINYAFSTNLQIYKLYDFAKDKEVVGEFEKFPSYEWIWNWDQTIKEKAAKKENPQPKKRFNPAAMTTEELLAKLEEKNRRRAEHNLPPLTLMEYLKSKGYRTSEVNAD